MGCQRDAPAWVSRLGESAPPFCRRPPQNGGGLEPPATGRRPPSRRDAPTPRLAQTSLHPNSQQPQNPKIALFGSQKGRAGWLGRGTAPATVRRVGARRRRSDFADCAVGSGQWAEPPPPPWALHRRGGPEGTFWTPAGGPPPDPPEDQSPGGGGGSCPLPILRARTGGNADCLLFARS